MTDQCSLQRPPKIVLLPGNMCDARLWRDVAPRLGGCTPAMPVFDVETSIDEMARSVLDAHPGTLIPVGFSMGGIVALAIARHAPERVAAMGLIGTNPSADLPERAAVRPAQQRAVFKDGALEEIVRKQLMPAYLSSANAGNEELRSLIVAMALDLGPDVFVKQSEALRTRPDQRDVPPRFDRPLFLACGAEDALCPPEWHRAMAATSTDSELHIIADAGHMLPLEQGAALAMPLARWLTKVTENIDVGIS